MRKVTYTFCCCQPCTHSVTAGTHDLSHGFCTRRPILNMQMQTCTACNTNGRVNVTNDIFRQEFHNTFWELKGFTLGDKLRGSLLARPLGWTDPDYQTMLGEQSIWSSKKNHGSFQVLKASKNEKEKCKGKTTMKGSVGQSWDCVFFLWDEPTNHSLGWGHLLLFLHMMRSLKTTCSEGTCCCIICRSLSRRIGTDFHTPKPAVLPLV